MNGISFKEMPWCCFLDFIKPGIDRFLVLKKILNETGLVYSVPEIAGNRHFIIAPSSSRTGTHKSPVILVAHYDRYDESPGANDNSAGVFILMEAAINLLKTKEKNWIIIFTDKEELKPGEGIMSQGAYTLAAGLKTLKLEKSRIFCFDVCGTGDTLIISTTLDYLLKRDGYREGEKTRKSLASLRNSALEAAGSLRKPKAYLAPTPLSDDAGFFRAGLAAQTLTVLPSREYAKLRTELQKDPGFAEILVNAEMWKKKNNNAIPETWQILNSPKDNYMRLTPENFPMMVRFAEALCKN